MDRRRPHPIRFDRYGRYVGRREQERAARRKAKWLAAGEVAATWMLRLVGLAFVGGAFAFAGLAALTHCHRR